MLTLDRSAVASSPEALGGTLVFRGSRVPVQTLLDYQAYGGQDGGQALLRGASRITRPCNQRTDPV